MDNITIFEEMLELVVKYDWAVEGASAPSDCKLSREGATKWTIQNNGLNIN